MRISRWSLLCGLSLVALAASFPQSAQAAPITYTLTGTGTGSLGGTAFSNAAMTFTLVGDTSGLAFPFGPGVPSVPVTATGLVGGFSAFTFTSAISFFNNQNVSVAGFGLTGSSDIFDVSDPSLAAWDAISSFGPLGIVSVPGNLGQAFGTTAGNFILNGVGTQGTLQAVVAGGAAPEPATIALIALGGLGCVVARRRK
jgi:hypothetical protein